MISKKNRTFLILIFIPILLVGMLSISCGKKEEPQIEPLKTVTFTIIEGKTVKETATVLAKSKLVNKKKFLREVKKGEFDYPFIDQSIKGTERLEGFLFPDTYEIFEDEDEHGIIERMLENFNNKVYKPLIKDIEASGRSFKDILIMASLCEMESSNQNDERKKVASVFYNRLNIGMKLQSCATVNYCLGIKKFILSYSDIAVDSPYNTYKVEGLPIGPICSPSLSSFEAAIFPAETDYLYFVASPKKDGTNNFASTEEEFNKLKNQLS